MIDIKTGKHQRATNNERVANRDLAELDLSRGSPANTAAQNNLHQATIDRPPNPFTLGRPLEPNASGAGRYVTGDQTSAQKNNRKRSPNTL